MNSLYHYVGLVVVWACIMAVLFVFIYGLRIFGYLISRTKLYQNISSWVWFYILRKNLPTENIRYAYKMYGYWSWAGKYRLRNIKQASKLNK